MGAEQRRDERTGSAGAAASGFSWPWMIGYSALLSVGLMVSAPWWLGRMVTTQRYREGLRERLGWVPAGLRAAVRGRRVVWMHAVSVGEVLAISRLVRELEEALGAAADAGPGEPWAVVVSTTTRTGQAMARERFGADRVFYLPLDFAWAVRAFLRVLRPAMVLLAESEIWPRLLHECARAEVPVAVVNARVSDRSFRRARAARAVWGRVLGRVSLWLAQSEDDARRLVTLGAGPEAVRVAGNLKFDVRARDGNRMAALLRNALGDRPVFVAGSTAAGEDEMVIRSFRDVWSEVPRAVLVIAPRHPERFSQVLELAKTFGAVRASVLTPENVDGLLEQMVRADESGTSYGSCTRCVVLDTVGDLAAVYGIADAAFVGGSLIAGSGGHNPLEPAQWSVPVVMGRSYENFRAVVDAMWAAGGIDVLDTPGQVASLKEAKGSFDFDRAAPVCAELTQAMVRLLQHPAEARAMGDRGRTVFEREGGATARSIQALMAMLRRRDVANEAETV